jgi:hypothetical protein
MDAWEQFCEYKFNKDGTTLSDQRRTEQRTSEIEQNKR